jgi:anhydro-N-acetylmuramic acid kinase
MSLSCERLIMGLMSGTSHDGVDAALVKFNNNGEAEFLSHRFTSYPPSLINTLSRGAALTAQEICELNVTVAMQFSKAAIALIKKSGINSSSLDAIASHGQTLWHAPPTGRTRFGSTLQIGDPSVISINTAVRVISNFRAADMALGGQGAPLVPFADHMLFKKHSPIAVHNLGGISNVTLVTSDIKDVRAFDTGPACALLDEAARKLFSKPQDKGGSIARGGKLDAKLLKHLLKHPYLRRKPPKSTGKEVFGAQMLQEIIKTFKLKNEDLLCTLTHFTAQSIGQAYKRFVLPEANLDTVIFAGGGVKNKFLMELLKQELSPLIITLTDNYGIPSNAREAVCFAILGYAYLENIPANLPQVTGASKATILGQST